MEESKSSPFFRVLCFSIHYILAEFVTFKVSLSSEGYDCTELWFSI